MSAAKQASLSEVLDLLLAGKTLTIQFPSITASDSFRSSLYRHKKRTETQMEDVGIDIDIDKQSLVWGCTHTMSTEEAGVNVENSSEVIVTMSLIDRKQTTYTIVSIQDATGTEETEVPRSMGKA